MASLRQFLFRLRSLGGAGRREATMAAEIRGHLAMLEAENRAAGLAPEESRCEARRQFGGVDQIKEAYRDEWTFVWLEHLRKDLQFAVRTLGKAPGFTAVTVLILALGIGTNAAIFSWIRLLLFDPLPGAADAARLVAVENFAGSGAATGDPLTTSYLDFRDYRDHLSLLDVAAMARGALALGDGRDNGRVWCELVSGNFFAVLGLKPEAGRFFSPDEQGDVQNAHPVAVISHGFWRTRYQASPSAIGSTLRINRVPFTIVGVAPEGFYGTQPGLAYQVWVPLTMYGDVTHTGTWMLRDRATRNFMLLARLKPGVTVSQARTEASALATLMASRNAEDRGVNATVVPLWQWHYGPQQLLLRPMAILMGACLVLFLIVCANVANLQLTRATARRQEFGIRLTLGAGRRRLVRLMVVEALVLALAGVAAGLLIAAWMGGALPWVLPAVATPVVVPPSLAGGAFGVAMLLAAAVTAVAGLLPALQVTRANLNDVLKAGGRGGTAGVPSHRLRSFFVIVEVALAVVALVGAATALRSLRESRALAPGFAPAGQVLAQFNLSTAGYSRAQADSFYRRMTDELLRLPGVTAVSYADTVPLGFSGGNWEQVEVEGYQPARDENMKIFRNMIGPGYFNVMRIPLVEGRDFDLRDDAKAPSVAIVSREFVRRFIPRGSVLGRQIHGWGRWFTIVGVVEDIKIHQVGEGALPFFYIPIRQEYRPEYGLTFHVRTDAPAGATIAGIRRVAAGIDPELMLFDAQPMTEYIAGSLFRQKLVASMLSVLGAVGLTLAAMGLYSVMAFAVAQRTGEIGVRMALGARPGDVLALVLRQGMVLTAAGVVVGSVVAFAAARLAAAFLTTIHPADPGIYLATALVMAGFALASMAVPAWRALRVNPLVALRQE